MDKVHNFVAVQTSEACCFKQSGKHTYACTPKCERIAFVVTIVEGQEKKTDIDFRECLRSSEQKWQRFWQEGGLISFEGSTDPREQAFCSA